MNAIAQNDARPPKAEHPLYDSLDLATFFEESRYKFLMGSVVPRPIALVMSLGEDGVLNAVRH